jgi:hypothetical protein
MAEEHDDLTRSLDAVLAPRLHFEAKEIQRGDPMGLVGWPATLPLEIALQESTPKEICSDYGITRSEWDAIRTNPHFINELGRAVEELRVDGTGFKMRVRMQATEMLKENFRLVHDPATPHAVKADLIKHTIRVAGYDASREQAAAAVKSGSAVAITINLA